MSTEQDNVLYTEGAAKLAAALEQYCGPLLRYSVFSPHCEPLAAGRQLAIMFDADATHLLRFFMMDAETAAAIEPVSLEHSNLDPLMRMRFFRDNVLLPSNGLVLVRTGDMLRLRLRVTAPIEQVVLWAIGHACCDRGPRRRWKNYDQMANAIAPP